MKILVILVLAVVLLAQNFTSTPGTVVQPGNVQNTTAWGVTHFPGTTTVDALSSSGKSAVTTSVNVKATAGNVYGLSVISGSTTGCWLELINSATAGTLGTNVIVNVGLPNAGVVNLPPGDLALGNFTNGIAVGVASAIGGSSVCTTSSSITVFYK